MVASSAEKRFTSLPYRLPCGYPYVVVFFEECHKLLPQLPLASTREEAETIDRAVASSAQRAQRQLPINTDALGWAATVHGVRRIEDTSFSRSQAVVHLFVTDSDLA